jgi:hypothetical protein
MKMLQEQAVFILVLIPILLLALVITMFPWGKQVLKMMMLNVPGDGSTAGVSCAEEGADECTGANLTAKNPMN